jgi:hypothetical protein
MTSGFYSTFRAVKCRNNLQGDFWHYGGVGPVVDDISTDIDGTWYSGSYPYHSVAGLYIQSEGGIFRGLNMTHTNIKLEVRSGQSIQWCKFYGNFDSDSFGNTSPDTTGGAGLHLVNNDATSKIIGIEFNFPWAASADTGVEIEGTGIIDGVVFNGGAIHNNDGKGATLSGANVKNISFIGVLFSGNNQAGGSDEDLLCNIGGDVNVIGCRFRRERDWSTTPYAHITKGASQAGNINVIGSVRDTNVGAGGAIQDLGGSGAVRVAANVGFTYNDVLGGTTTFIRVGGSRQSAGLWVEDLGFGRVDIAGTSPGLNLYDSDAASDEKYLQYGPLGIIGYNDSFGSGTQLASWTRSGASWTEFKVHKQLTALDSIKSSSATAGIGYAAGAGGTVSQGSGSGKATGVTLNTVTGLITMDSATLNADTTVSFTLMNSAISSTDTIILNHVSGGTAGAYTLNAQASSGSASINVRNVTAGNLGEAIVIRFAVIKSVSA